MRLLRALTARRLILPCLLASALAGAASQGSTAAEPTVQVVASGLDNPRKLSVGTDGALYVAEAGAGGRDRCLGPRTSPTCVGLTGSVTRLRGGEREQVVVGLPSIAGTDAQRAAGPVAVLRAGSGYDVLLQDAYVNRAGGNALGADGRVAGTLVSTPPGRAAPHVIADLARFEARHDPDGGAGPGTALGDPPVDSDPYAFIRSRGGWVVADAAANDLLRVGPRGAISVLAVLPTQTVTPTPAERARYRIPAAVRRLQVQSVPTSVVTGPDGALYVGELTGVPFRAGLARVWRVAADGHTTVFARGLTMISDLAFSGRDLLVLEYAGRGLGAGSTRGALIRIEPDGRRTVVASSELAAPTGLAVTHGYAYISNHGTSPGAGPLPHGEVVRVRLRG